MKRISSVILLMSGIFIGFLTGAFTRVAHSDFVKANYDQVIAQLGETKITRAELAERLLTTRGKRDLLGMELLRGEYQDRLLIIEAARKKNITVSEDEINQRVKETMEIEVGSKDQPRHLLADRAKVILLAEKILDINVTDQDAYNFYKDPTNARIFLQPEMAKLICVASLKSADATTALRRIRAGDDPKKISEQFSYDPRLKEMKGDLGWVMGTALPTGVQIAIFGGTRKPPMKPGEATEVMTIDSQNPVPNDKGEYERRTEYWILYIEDIRPQMMPSFNDTKKIAIHYCRLSRFAVVYNSWMLKQAEEVNTAAGYLQITDLFNPTDGLAPTKLDITRYSKSTFLAPGDN